LTAGATKPVSEVMPESLDGFLLMALRNPKDRMFMLKLDKDIESFVQDARCVFL
jgi:hypothetical protein